MIKKEFKAKLKMTLGKIQGFMHLLLYISHFYLTQLKTVESILEEES